MTAVTYHGEYPADQVDEDGTPFIEQHGYKFTPGKSVDVKDEQHLGKLAGNRFFKVAGKSDKDAVEQGQDEADKAETEALRAWLAERGVNAHHKLGRDKLEGLKADYLKTQEKAAAE